MCSDETVVGDEVSLGSVPAESRLEQLIGRLLVAAETSLAEGDFEAARATAEEVRAVSPEERRAADILERVTRSQRAPEGERALMTVLFADLANSTALAGRVEPEVMRDLLAAYRGAASRSVERFGGHVLQWLGDGVLAVFGYRRVFEDDARRAVSAALDLVAAITEAGPDMRIRFGVELEVRAGVHTGLVVVAEVGDQTARGERDSIVGAAPNLAARIQGETAPGTVVISDVTQQLVDPDFHLRSLGLRQLKGVVRPVELFAVQGPRHPGARLDADRFRRTRLVGRDQPRALLAGAWEQVSATADSTAGGGQAVLIAGEAGIGKSRVAADIRQRVARSGGATLEAGCLAYHTNIPLWPVARMMERVLDSGVPADLLASLVGHLQVLEIDVAEVAPLFAPLLGIAQPEGYPAPELEPTALLDRTLDRLIDWLSRLPQRRPTLLVFEDLHWADPTTIELLGRVVRRVPTGLLLVMTTRDPEALGWRDRVLDVSLDHLPSEAAASLVEQLVGTTDLAEETRASIIDRGEGIPLFIEELTRSALAAGESEPLPLRLHELLAGRLKAPGLDLRVAQVAATVGSSFDLATVAAVIDDRDRVIGSLAQLAEVGIIESTGDLLDGVGYRFGHALLRDAAYETQVLETRLQTHAGVAHELERTGADPALVAQHLDLADLPDRAIPFYMAAAQGAQARGAHAEAIQLLTRVVELVKLIPASDDRDVSLLTARMLRALSISATEGYAAPGVRADHRKAEIITERLGDRPEVMPALLAIWVTGLTSSELRTSGRLIARLLQMASDPMFAWFEPEARAGAGFQSLHQGDLAEARFHLERAVEGFAQRPADQVVSWFWPLPHDPVAITKTGLACVSNLEGNAVEAQRWEREAIGRAEGVGFPGRPISLAFIKGYGAWGRRLLGDITAMRALGAEIVAIGQEHGSSYWERLGSLYVGAPSLDLDPDPEFVEQTIGFLRAMGHEALIASDLAYLAKLRTLSGRTDLAVETIESAIRIVHNTGESLHLPELLRLRALYESQLIPEGGRRVVDLLEALRVAQSQNSNLVALRVAMDLARLPERERPENWQQHLKDARKRFPPTARYPELTEAESLSAIDPSN